MRPGGQTPAGLVLRGRISGVSVNHGPGLPGTSVPTLVSLRFERLTCLT